MMYEETDIRHLKERIFIKDNSNFVKKYEHIRAKLKELLGDDAVYIEHIGTTAVNDISAYPVIDIAIASSTVSNCEKIKKKLIEQKGFIQVDSLNKETLIRKGSYEKPEYYIHLVEAQSDFFKSMVRFRDELKLKPKKRESYDSIHYFAKEEYRHSLEKYHHSKTSFIRGVSNQYGAQNYDDKIHVEKIERTKVDKSAYYIEKICQYILLIGAGILCIELLFTLSMGYIYTKEAISLLAILLTLSLICTGFIIRRIFVERTNQEVFFWRILYIVLGSISIIYYVVSIISTLIRVLA